MGKDDPLCDVIHASCVAIDPSFGLLIVGASGSGKSSLALMMMALGATLVSDDRTKLTMDSREGDLVACAPETIQSMIEARGIGILNVQSMPYCVIRAVVDLDKLEQERLPPARIRRLLNQDIPEYHRSDGPYFAAALIQLLKGGRVASLTHD
ncbi:serine kinase [Pacificibacter sp. AS14]|uniref:HPr kinase/phosphorylase n=1 Tax=Pacificibacter sp. AS14 TaxID=3135785 RepID=UPI003180D1F2